jgi:hypothetical protein
VLSKVGGVRLLWEENALDAIGAFCVGAFVLGVTWMVLEGLLGASPFLAGPAAIVAAVWTLGEISRQRYPERRTHSSRHVPAGARVAIRPYQVEDANRAQPAPGGGTDVRTARRLARRRAA